MSKEEAIEERLNNHIETSKNRHDDLLDEFKGLRKELIVFSRNMKSEMQDSNRRHNEILDTFNSFMRSSVVSHKLLEQRFSFWSKIGAGLAAGILSGLGTVCYFLWQLAKWLFNMG